MPPKDARSPARLVAPAALALFVVAFALVVLSSAGDGEEAPVGTDTDTGTAADDSARGTTRPATTRGRETRATYTVKRGDTLGTIAEKTGVEVERLQELNPQLDPQALIAGQKIKLRE